MKIIQIVPTLFYGDAIGNYTLAIKHIIEGMGYQTAIYTMTIHPRIKEPDVYLVKDLPKLKADDVMIYHLAIGTALNREVLHYPCRKVCIYHNITPPHFFEKDSMDKADMCQAGLDDVKFLAGKFDFCIADSEFNRQDLIRMGYDGRNIKVVPVIVALEDYKQTPDADRLASLRSDGWTNIVFVGRVAPNKKHEDLIRCFGYYRKYINQTSRLILVGSFGEGDNYYNDLKDYTQHLNIPDVNFYGHVSFAEILSFYSAADIFLCMSEHEGFCVPLLEAMSFDVPIVAYKSTAVTETLGGGGILLDSKDPVLVAHVMDRLCTDKALREQVIERQRERFADFQYEPLSKLFRKTLEGFIEGRPESVIPDAFREYDALYALIEQRLAAQGQDMGFTKESFRHTSEATAHVIDLAKLADSVDDNRSFLEICYLAFFDRLPDAPARASWETLMDVLSPKEFQARVVNSLMDTEEFRANGTDVVNNLYRSPTET